jgi:hypothetical protein
MPGREHRLDATVNLTLRKYRLKADECLEYASHSTREADRAEWLRLAEEWLRLAQVAGQSERHSISRKPAFTQADPK